MNGQGLCEEPDGGERLGQESISDGSMSPEEWRLL